MNKLAVFAILVAGVLWGIIGLFLRALQAMCAFSTIQVVSLRLITAAIIFVSIGLVKGKDSIKVKLKDLPILFLFGFFGLFVTASTYFLSITYSSLAVAAILMYTAPVIVMIVSLFLFGEKVNKNKVLSIILATSGCILVSGIFEGDANATFFGIFMGFVSGFAYASYSIFGTYALRRVSSFTASAWAFIFASLSSVPFLNLPDVITKVGESKNPLAVVGLIICMGFFSAVAPYLLYTYGLSKIRASTAIILASVEPLVAAVLGFFYGEYPSVFSLIGIVLIFVAVVLTSLKKENS